VAEVLAIVLNWRQCDATLSVLADLRACGSGDLAILLIDNGSGDGSAERLRAAAGDAVELLAFADNLGYCAAMNRGLARARERGSEFALFLNNDVRLPQGFLEPLRQVLSNDPSVACVGPTVLDPRGRVWSEGGGVGFRPNLVFLHGQGGVPAPRTHGPEAVEFMPGACALFRVADLVAVGGLDEGYFMYWEDADLGCRLRARGKKIVWLPWVSVVHDASLSSGGGRSPLRKYMCAVNTVRFLRTHGTPRLWLAFALLDCLSWPLTLLSGTGLRAALAKGRGLVAGIFGHRVSAADVRRFHPDPAS
jgi:hypothetical protein